ncbi:hypothetical protein BR93DRAFT_489376 [Coniochaeta sp. PMI_546]|nr:hypothetical protein BR93DRAFT_489376 [Coniochaeta sp. PMI_546]
MSIFAISRSLLLLVFPILVTSQPVVHSPPCTVESQPNPIAKQYPNLPTGTLNTTVLIIQIPLKVARQIVPRQWPILEHVYRALIPNLPRDVYPVFVQAGLDHDIGLAALDIHLPDFSRIGYEFPFIDLLGDNYTSFTWSPAQLLSAAADYAIVGSRGYGTTVYPAIFDPSCHPFGRRRDGNTYFQGWSNDTLLRDRVWAGLEISPVKQGRKAQYSLDVFQNITNQPIFGNGTICDSQVRLFNTTLSTGTNEPTAVTARVYGNLEPLGQLRREWDAAGWQVDTPFVEYNALDCRTLQGYAGTGPGD